MNKAYRALIIDDNPGKAILANKYLKEAGITDIHIANTFQKAVEMLNEQEFALVVLDYSLDNGKTGLDILDEFSFLIGKVFFFANSTLEDYNDLLVNNGCVDVFYS